MQGFIDFSDCREKEFLCVTFVDTPRHRDFSHRALLSPCSILSDAESQCSDGVTRLVSERNGQYRTLQLYRRHELMAEGAPTGVVVSFAPASRPNGTPASVLTVVTTATTPPGVTNGPSRRGAPESPNTT
jgi:hypothetical protein